MEWLKWLVGVAIALGGFALGLLKNFRENKQEATQGAAASAKLEQKVDYIKEKVDAIQENIKAQGEKVDRLSEEVTRHDVKISDLSRRMESVEKKRVS